LRDFRNGERAPSMMKMSLATTKPGTDPYF